MAKNPLKKASAESTADNSLPLFFRKPVPLGLEQHGQAGLLPGGGVAFAAETNSIVLNAIEFAEAAKMYPIVFTDDEATVPVAILGLEKQNYFVSTKGEWKEGAYVPAYVRKYPFVFLNLPEQKQFVLCIDEAAPQFAPKGGKDTQPFYTKDEKPSDLTRNALEFCTAYHNHHLITRQFCDALKEADLLTPSRSTAKLFNDREINLGGFQVIDEKKLAALPDAKVLEFYKKGYLPLVYFSLMSSSNWKKLADMAAARDKN